MSTLPQTQWEPSLYPDGEFGKFGNTYRAILSLGVGDNLDLAKVVEGAPNLKSAYVWRTKDGWEFRVATYSGIYGFSIEPDELKEDKGLFDTILRSADIELPFADKSKCACGCGAPSKAEFLPGHKERFNDESNTNVQVDEEDSQPKVAPTLTDDVPDEDQGENVPDVEPEVETPDAAQSPEPAATKPRRTEPDAYSKYLAKAILNPKKVAEEASESENNEFLTQGDVDDYLRGLVDPMAYVISDDAYSVAVELSGIRDQFVGVSPFPDASRCVCGCGGVAPRFGNYLVGHDLRHRSWLLSQIKRGDGHALEALKNLGWTRFLYPDFRLPSDFTSEDSVWKRVSGNATDEIKPSQNRKHLYMMAFKLALADVGYYTEDTDLTELSVSQSTKLRSLWRNKQDFLRAAEATLDSVDVGGSLVNIAGELYALVMTSAIRAGFNDIKYSGFVRFPQGSRNFSPTKVKNGQDVESLSLVSEPVYTQYRDEMEFSGLEFDPMAKFFNYLATEISSGRKPDWVTSENEDPWMAAAESIGNLPKEAKPFMAKWWVDHGYKAHMQSPPREFLVLAKGVADYTATHAKEIIDNVKVAYESGDCLIVSVENPKQDVLWYNDFLMEVTRTIDGQVYGRLKMNEDDLSNSRWRESAERAGLLNDSSPKEVKIDSNRILWLSPK